MSVQAGIWNFDDRPVDRNLLNKFSDCLKHQGPDAEFVHESKSIALVYRPFHTTKESRKEKQPYLSKRGFVLTWDGRLDNRTDLISTLGGTDDESTTDVSIVAAAFDRWEAGSFRQIIGDWAVCVWNPHQHELTFANDYMAIRHIFYSLKRDRLWWATDLTPIVLLDPDKFHIDEDYIAGYFGRDPDGSVTPYREISQVPPGHFVRIRPGKIIVERYWRFDPKSGIRYKTDAEYEEHFLNIFRRSVRRRVRSDSVVLAELSGGLDSSSIVCVADDILQKSERLTPRLDTISFFDKNEPNGDDWRYFPIIEKKRGRIGIHIDAGKVSDYRLAFDHADFCALPGFVAVRRQVEIDRAAVMTERGYRVVLSGTGGDEFMGGIPNPDAQLADLIVQFKFVNLAQQLLAWGIVKQCPWIQLLWRAVVALLPPSLGQFVAREARLEPWIEQRFAKRSRMAKRQLGFNDDFGLWLPTRRSCLGGVFLMANRLAKHSKSRLAAEEYRYPYLDQNLIEFILSIPASQLLRPGERRSLMRRSLVGTVPTEILSRRTKQLGQRTPAIMLRNNWEDLHSALRWSICSRLGYINHACFVDKLRSVVNGNEMHVVHTLRTIALEFWLRSLVDRGIIEAGMDSALPMTHHYPAPA
jgi:asparagine synthase (glutamine-hydrolysing)